MFSNLFKKPSIKCPRCLGKGIVDNNDIERLNKELEWQSGKCAYCNGVGKVHKKMIANVPVDLSYLTLDISKLERWKIVNGNKNALNRAKQYQKDINDFENYVINQYFVENLDIETIANLYFENYEGEIISVKERNEFLKYVEKIVRKK